MIKKATAIIIVFAFMATAFALPVLAEPTNQAKFVIGQKSYKVNKESREMDAVAFMKNGRAYVPVRFLGYSLGMTDKKIKWDGATRTVTLITDKVTVKLVIGDKTLLVNGRARQMDVVPLIRNDRIYLPARWVAEAFDYEVGWDNATRTVLVGPKGRLPKPDLQPVTQKASSKPQLELLHEIPLGKVSANEIPDVTRDRWEFGVPATKPIVSPDGKYVLVVGESEMTLYNSSTGKRLWQKRTYGAISYYEIIGNRLFTGEKYSYGKKRKHSYITCLDLKTGKEFWGYDVQKNLESLTNKYMPAGARPSMWGALHLASHGNKLIVKGSNSWKKENRSGKVEVLLALNHKGKLLWKVNSHGYPGIIGMSRIGFIEGKLFTGNYSYGDKIDGKAYASAFDLNTGKELWKFKIENDPNLNYGKSVNVAVDVAGDKVVAAANFGKVYVLSSKGKKIREFTVFKPVIHKGVTICTNVWDVQGGSNTVILAPSKSVVKGATVYTAKPPAEHPNANSIMVFNLNGNLQWKFRLGGSASGMLVKNNYLVFSTKHNQDTLDYSYTGIYVFDLSRKGKVKKSALDRYLGYYHTDGIVHSGVSASEDGRIIAATTWPTRVGAKKYGKHACIF